MRTFAILMLLLNLAYLAWNSTRQEETIELPQGQSTFLPAEQTLELLTELSRESSSPQGQEEILTEPVDVVPAAPDQNAEIELFATTATEQSAIPEARCVVASGFDNQDEASAFIAEISEMEFAGTLSVQQEQISSTWWVHLPPFRSQSEAQVVIDELVAKGIDNFYMRTGELAGGISLGVFSREQSATVAQTELRARGYETSIKEIPRYVSKSYVTIEISDPARFESTEWKAFLATKTKLEVTEKLCETIAR